MANQPTRLERATLTIRGANGFGLLRLEMCGMTIRVRLKARHCKTLRAYATARKEDASGGVEEVFEGVRTNGEIGSIYAGQGDYEFPYTPGPEAVKAYRSQIANRIRIAMPKGIKPPCMFETRRSVGTRIAVDLEVVDLINEKASA